MAAIFDIHHPLVGTFGILGNIVSIFVYLAPVPTFLEIYRRKSVLGFQSLPYVIPLFSSMLWLYYALLKTNAILLISINSIGCIVEAVYIFIYLVYAPTTAKKHTAKLVVVLNVVLFFAILLFTRFKLVGQARVLVVGWVCVAVSVSVFAAPLSIVVKVVRTRSVKFLPFALSCSLTLSAVMWFCYGVFQEDPCIWIPNVQGFFLGLFQMSLYAKYRNAREVLAEMKLPATAEHIINIAKLGISDQVHPVDHEAEKTGSENDDHENDDIEDKIVALPLELPSRATVQLDLPALLVVCKA